MQVTLSLLFAMIFVIFGQGCLELTNQTWMADKNSDLIYEDSSFQNCREELFSKREYMGFIFQVVMITFYIILL